MDENKVSNIHDSNIWPNVKPFVQGGLTAVTLHVIPSLGLKSIHKLHKHVFRKTSYRLDPMEKELEDKFYRFFFPNHKEMSSEFNLALQQKLFNIAAKQMLSSLVKATLEKAMLFGTFGFLTRKVEAANEGMPLTFYQNFGCGLFAGAVGAIVSTPFLISCISLYQSANLARISIIQHLYGKAANEGILALWKGGIPTGTTSWLSNMGMLATYNPFYDYLKESVGLTANSSVLGAGLMSGFFASTCSYPYIHVHKAMINMKPGISGKYQFAAHLGCALKILKFGGPLAFYRGSRPYIFRGTTRVTILWYCLEKVKKTGEYFGW